MIWNKEGGKKCLSVIFSLCRLRNLIGFVCSGNVLCFSVEWSNYALSTFFLRMTVCLQCSFLPVGWPHIHSVSNFPVLGQLVPVFCVSLVCDKLTLYSVFLRRTTTRSNYSVFLYSVTNLSQCSMLPPDHGVLPATVGWPPDDSVLYFSIGLIIDQIFLFLWSVSRWSECFVFLCRATSWSQCFPAVYKLTTVLSVCLQGDQLNTLCSVTSLLQCSACLCFVTTWCLFLCRVTTW